MTPAPGLFYGGGSAENVLSAFQQAFILLGIVPVQWVPGGLQPIVRARRRRRLLGRLHGLDSGVGLEPNVELAPRIPHQLLMIFEMMVAVFTSALISGAIAERMKFGAYVVFIALWTTLVFDPVAHWVWGPGGWIRRMGALDFAGGLVIHLTSGLAALCSVWVLGKRKGLDTEDLHPHNLTLTALGTGLLWFCWLGLNAGQARGATSAGAASVVATILAGSAAIVSWSALEYLHKSRVTVLGVCTGAIPAWWQ
jgi:Amt family ammonium transporter